MANTTYVTRLARRLASPRTLLPLVFLSFGTMASAKVVYVNRNAPGINQTGTSWATAFQTLQNGVSAAAAGDEVWVAKSTPAAVAYSENITIYAAITLYGGFAGTETIRSQRNWHTNTTVLDGADYTVVTSGVQTSQAVVDGFTIRNGGHGIFAYYGNATASNCVITDTFGAVSAYYGNVTAINCTLSNNNTGVIITSGAASVSNCNINQNARGVYLYSGSATVRNSLADSNGLGILVSEGNVNVTNCTVSGSLEGGVLVTYGSATIANCIVSHNLTGIGRYDDSVPVTLSHNNVYGNRTSDYLNIDDPTGTNGNISADPKFLNRTGGNYHLFIGSPCANAGDDSVVTTGQTDLDGKPRIAGSHVDMGAYEYTAGPMPFTLPEAAGALRAAGGLVIVPAGDANRLDVATGGGIGIPDAVRIVRKVAGLESNP